MVHSPQGDQVIEQWGKSKNTTSTIWGTDWDYFSIANYVVISLCSSPCWDHEALTITNSEVLRVSRGTEKDPASFSRNRGGKGV